MLRRNEPFAKQAILAGAWCWMECRPFARQRPRGVALGEPALGEANINCAPLHVEQKTPGYRAATERSLGLCSFRKYSLLTMKSLSSLLCFWLASILAVAGEANWPEFRGPRGNGTTPNAHLPLNWGEETNASAIKWSTPIHGKAWSSPVIWGQQLW